jgi:hypothetical protein
MALRGIFDRQRGRGDNRGVSGAGSDPYGISAGVMFDAALGAVFTAGKLGTWDFDGVGHGW